MTLNPSRRGRGSRSPRPADGLAEKALRLHREWVGHVRRRELVGGEHPVRFVAKESRWDGPSVAAAARASRANGCRSKPLPAAASRPALACASAAARSFSACCSPVINSPSSTIERTKATEGSVTGRRFGAAAQKWLVAHDSYVAGTPCDAIEGELECLLHRAGETFHCFSCAAPLGVQAVETDRRRCHQAEHPPPRQRQQP